MQRRIQRILLFDSSWNQQLPTRALCRWLVAGDRIELLPRQRATFESLLRRLSPSLHLHQRVWQLLQLELHCLQL